MKRADTYLGPDALVHRTDGMYGSDSLMRCEASTDEPSAWFRVRNLFETDRPPTCLICVARDSKGKP